MSHQYVDTDRALAELCARWRRSPLLALDTEFIRTDTFYPIIGLVQVSDGSGVWLLDPLTIGDWEPFKALLKQPDLPKVFHSCSEDLEVLQRFLDCLPQPLFDTQIGAALAGYPAGLSYQNLVQACLDLHVPKGETRSDWLQRPLSESQCQYAAQDVLHLPILYRHIGDRLAARGREAWWREEGERLVAAAASAPGPEDYYRRIATAWKLSRRQQGLLQRLCVWREQQARERDIPRGRVLKDPVCVEIARRAPQALAQLAAVPEISPGAVRRDGEALLALVGEALAAAEDTLPPPLPRPLPPEQGRELKALRRLFEGLAEREGIAQEILVRKRDLEALLRLRENGRWVLPDSLQGWRAALVNPLLAHSYEGDGGTHDEENL